MAGSVRHEIKLGDKVYYAAKLTEANEDNLSNWLRSIYVERNQQVIDAQPTAEGKATAMRVLMDQVGSLSIHSAFGAKTMGTFDGVSRMLFEALRANHPDLTIEQLRKLMWDDSANKPKDDMLKAANDTFERLQLSEGGASAATNALEGKLMQRKAAKRHTRAKKRN